MTTTANTVLIGTSAGGAINSADANGTIAIGYEAGRLLTSGAGIYWTSQWDYMSS